MKPLAYRRYLMAISLIYVLAGCSPSTNVESNAERMGEWPHHGKDLASSKYSPLEQINPDNFNQLEIKSPNILGDGFRFMED